jgi:hypothetical protein
VVMLNAAETVAPASTSTDDGTDAAAGLLLVSLTLAPAGGAGARRVTVLPELFVPPTKIVAVRFTEATASGFTVTVACALAVEDVAVMVAVVVAPT